MSNDLGGIGTGGSITDRSKIIQRYLPRCNRRLLVVIHYEHGKMIDCRSWLVYIHRVSEPQHKILCVLGQCVIIYRDENGILYIIGIGIPVELHGSGECKIRACAGSAEWD